MFFYILFACLLVSTTQESVKSSRITTPSWEDCGGEDSLLKIHSIDLDNPIKIGRENPIRISMNATQIAEIAGDSLVSIRINKNLRVLNQNLPIWVPCIAGIGSCEMTLCEIFKIHRRLVCSIMDAAKKECACPSSPGEYIASINYLINFGIFPRAILAIGNGDYSMDMKITKDNKQVGCMKLNVAVKFV